MKRMLALTLLFGLAALTAQAGVCPYTPNYTNVGPGTFQNTTTTAKITVDSPYEYGTTVFHFPAGNKYSVSFEIRKFGSPVAAQIGFPGQTITATTTWTSYTIPYNQTDGFSAHLHTITYGSSGGVEIRYLNAQVTDCGPTPSPNPWVQIPLTAGLFRQVAPDPVTLPNPGTDITILSASQVKFTSLTNRPNVVYQIDVEPGYEYKFSFSFSFTVPNFGGETGVYPDGHEYYSASNCSSGCTYGNVADNSDPGNVVYQSNSYVFTRICTSYIAFRSTILPNVPNTNGKGMTVANFALYKRLR